MKYQPILRGLGTFAVLLVVAQPVRGDGGKVRLSRQAGPYLVTVFTTPTPLRVGSADVSVLVQDQKTEALLRDVGVNVCVSAPSEKHPSNSYPATREQATNKLLRAAAIEFPSLGTWTISVDVEGTPGAAHVEFTANVLGAPPPWRDRLPWIVWPLLLIGLFALRETAEHMNASRPKSVRL